MVGFRHCPGPAAERGSGDGNQSQRGEGEDVSTIRGRHIIQKHPYEY